MIATALSTPRVSLRESAPGIVVLFLRACLWASDVDFDSTLAAGVFGTYSALQKTRFVISIFTNSIFVIVTAKPYIFVKIVIL
jgi:hypothetical protein